MATLGFSIINQPQVIQPQPILAGTNTILMPFQDGYNAFAKRLMEVGNYNCRRITRMDVTCDMVPPLNPYIEWKYVEIIDCGYIDVYTGQQFSNHTFLNRYQKNNGQQLNIGEMFDLAQLSRELDAQLDTSEMNYRLIDNDPNYLSTYLSIKVYDAHMTPTSYYYDLKFYTSGGSTKGNWDVQTESSVLLSHLQYLDVIDYAELMEVTGLVTRQGNQPITTIGQVQFYLSSFFGLNLTPLFHQQFMNFATQFAPKIYITSFDSQNFEAVEDLSALPELTYYNFPLSRYQAIPMSQIVNGQLKFNSANLTPAQIDQISLVVRFEDWGCGNIW